MKIASILKTKLLVESKKNKLSFKTFLSQTSLDTLATSECNKRDCVDEGFQQESLQSVDILASNAMSKFLTMARTRKPGALWPFPTMRSVDSSASGTTHWRLSIQTRSHQGTPASLVSFPALSAMSQELIMIPSRRTTSFISWKKKPQGMLL
ncbi:unnamed protein product [Cylindrotheca closterium]|uniref:Uncharacterized protein n=1 Tax=Cylindrotheca closterium TaxID=2856 RepID=A0AAD2FP27_9STRA|nr:unnamed protein product [Cylindrotheca closterium]